MLIDRYNRRLNYLRISITDRCNLRCQYCSPPRSRIPKLSHDDILTYEEILRLVRIGVGLGISKVRVTGGEPLVRKGVCGFLDALFDVAGLSDLSLTTNGVLLARNLERIYGAGVRRLNISLDTLSREKYREITGMDAFDRVWEGIMAAHRRGFSPIKINVVALRGVNEDELADLARLTLAYPFHVRFIEYMPMGGAEWSSESSLVGSEILRALAPLGELIPLSAENGPVPGETPMETDGPAVGYGIAGAPGRIGLIRPLSHHFCHRCNRLRLTAEGRLRSCLLSDQEEDLRGPLRAGAPDEALARIFLDAVRKKPMGHRLDEQRTGAVCGRMSSIGG